METVKERLFKFIEHQGLSVRAFEQKCGLCNAYVANISKSISVDKLLQITTAFPELNSGWLMSGVGEMLMPSPIVAKNEESAPNIPNVSQDASSDLVKYAMETMKLLRSQNDIIAAQQRTIELLIKK